jgi:hypothetical protein
MCTLLDEQEWPEVDAFVSSQLPEGAEDPYCTDDDPQAPSSWWDALQPVRPSKP